MDNTKKFNKDIPLWESPNGHLSMGRVTLSKEQEALFTEGGQVMIFKNSNRKHDRSPHYWGKIMNAAQVAEFQKQRENFTPKARTNTPNYTEADGL